MTSDDEWKDFLSGNVNSPYPRVQDIHRKVDAPPVTGGSSFGGGSGSYLEWVFEKVNWVTEELPPFKQLMWLGEWLKEFSWRKRAVTAALGLGLALHVAYGNHDYESPAAWVSRLLAREFGSLRALVAVAGGIMGGAWAPSLVGSLIKGLLRFGVGLMVFGLTLIVFGTVVIIIYEVLRIVFDWPLPSLAGR